MLEASLPIAGAEFQVSRCAGCGLLFQNPRISADELGRHYPDDYGPYLAGEMRVGPTALLHLQHRGGYAHLPVRAGAFPGIRFFGRRAADILLIPDFVPGGRVLEIGCASGARLEMLRGLGWPQAMGIEFSETAAARARERGFKIFTGPVEQALESIEDNSLDAVVAGFVLEHLENPFALVRRIAAKLKPGGQLLFSTLNIGSPDFRLYGKYWYNLDLPRHHIFFRKRDLRRLTEGLFEVERAAGIAAPNDYTGSARYRLRHEPRFYDGILSRARNRILPLCVPLAWAGLCSRIAIRARRLP
jgi:2-polyprenyl-3-methyl-5-hydroxy-6-metoxy-1,4-benzoquinol methylase